jgi:nucleotidyltransferase/DNA polymerase involved in DNA repair
MPSFAGEKTLPSNVKGQYSGSKLKRNDREYYSTTKDSNFFESVMPFGYFDGLSADEAASDDEEDDNEDESSCDDCDDHDDPRTRIQRIVVLHADVDCFYCQCEQLDRQIAAEQPLGIGQKHIIVTCNYAARQYGVTKLMLKEDALRKCPLLLIIDGSDLTRYRQHSRHIYESFRSACQELIPKINNNACAVRKGCMDEMIMAVEASALVVVRAARGGHAPPHEGDQHRHQQQQRKSASSSSNSIRSTGSSPLAKKTAKTDIYVYGEHPSVDAMIRLTEDQTGAETMVHEHHHPAADHRTDHALLQQLHQTATLVQAIRQRILSQTGFAVTMGVSTNPFLAKLACGLRKPGIVNILAPEQCLTLVAAMPLRKITGVGRQTVRVLEPFLLSQQLDDHQHGRTDHCWTCRYVLCYVLGGKALRFFQRSLVHSTHFLMLFGWTHFVDRDVLQLPRASVIAALENVPSGLSPSYVSFLSTPNMTAFWSHSYFPFPPTTTIRQAADRLLDLCRGIDTSIIVDDEGGLQKTLSCENSFRRGTICTTEQVNERMRDLYQRLPRLFADRTAWSTHPELAYPKTIRLTVRVVDHYSAVTKKNKHRQRTSSSSTSTTTTNSMQQPFNGRDFLKSAPEQRAKLLQDAVTPLLHSLLFQTKTVMDVTRVNIALTNFQDVVGSPQRPSKAQGSGSQYATTRTQGSGTQGSVKRKRIDDFFARR